MQTLRVLAVVSLFGVAILVYALWGHAGRPDLAPAAKPEPPINVAQLTAERPVQQIELEYHEPDLPPGPGHDAFAAQCVICHSTRYVLNQPIFPRKTWTAEVQKMVKAYGAPIDPAEQEAIVNYLVAWHGKENPAIPAKPAAK
jgi:sulfite dehydrogenase (cytochrome) subunit B